MKIPRLVKLFLGFLLLSFTYSADDTIEFTAYLAEDKVNIQWVAYQRSKITGFTLEKSRDNKNFTAFKTIMDDGTKPETVEFIESDYEPMLGWSYYRIKHETVKGKTEVTHSAPVFYKADRMQKGELIVPESLTGVDDEEDQFVSIEEFNNVGLVFILRNKDGEEFYVEDVLTVEGEKLFLPTTDKLPVGDYMITACTKTPLLGLMVTAK